MQVAIDPTTGPRRASSSRVTSVPLKAKPGGVLERIGQTEAVGRPRPAGRADPGRRDLRDHERGRLDGPRRGSRRVLLQARPEDDHDRRPDRLPPPAREAGRAGRLDPACRRRSASSWRSATARWSTTSTTWRWSRATSRAQDDVLVRVHSECLTGDVFHSLRCDCGEQLESALSMIESEGQRRAAVPEPGGARDRAAEQAPGLQAPGGGPRHGRRQPQAGPARPTCATTGSAPRSSSTSG